MSDAAEDNVTEFQPAEPEAQTEQAPAQEAEPETRDVGGVAGDRLRSFIERIERLEEEKTALSDDIKEIYAELKGVGYDAKTVRKIVTLRKLDSEKRREADELLDLYKTAVGMVQIYPPGVGLNVFAAEISIPASKFKGGSSFVCGSCD